MNPVVSITATDQDTNGYVNVYFTNATKGSSWYSWRIKRRLAGTSTWTLLKEYVVDLPTYDFHDTTAPQNTLLDYSVTRVYLVGSTPTEETDTPEINILTDGSFYWLVNLNNEAQNFALRNVTADSFHDDVDYVNHRLIGRGRKTDQGTSYGYEGSLTVQMRDIEGGLTAAQMMAKLMAIKESQSALMLKTPFGQAWKVSLGQLDFTRIAGVGLLELSDVTIPYSQIV